jgi:hypothetical protein
MSKGLALLGVLLLIAQIWAAVNILNSAASTGAKVAWLALVLILPLIGFVAWLITGPRSQ